MGGLRQVSVGDHELLWMAANRLWCRSTCNKTEKWHTMTVCADIHRWHSHNQPVHCQNSSQSLAERASEKMWTPGEWQCGGEGRWRGNCPNSSRSECSTTSVFLFHWAAFNGLSKAAGACTGVSAERRPQSEGSFCVDQQQASYAFLIVVCSLLQAPIATFFLSCLPCFSTCMKNMSFDQCSYSVAKQ